MIGYTLPRTKLYHPVQTTVSAHCHENVALEKPRTAHNCSLCYVHTGMGLLRTKLQHPVQTRVCAEYHQMAECSTKRVSPPVNQTASFGAGPSVTNLKVYAGYLVSLHMRFSFLYCPFIHPAPSASICRFVTCLLNNIIALIFFFGYLMIFQYRDCVTSVLYEIIIFLLLIKLQFCTFNHFRYYKNVTFVLETCHELCH
jgi:hypothetical protein